jgi:methionyl-tRNA formyltransferase
VGSHVRVVFLVADDPIYLPAFMDRVLTVRAAATQSVYLVPARINGQSAIQNARRYYRTFGLHAAIQLGWRLLQVRAKRQSVEAVCRRRGVNAAAVHYANDAGFLEELRAISPDVVVSVSCPQILSRDLLEIPSVACLNIHGAILPAYRGIMPSFWMLANGEKCAGVSIHFVNEQIDAGDLCGQRTFDIEPTETLDQFLRRSKAVAADLVLEVLDAIERNAIKRVPLDLKSGSYYSWPDKEDVKRFRASGRRLW